MDKDSGLSYQTFTYFYYICFVPSDDQDIVDNPIYVATVPQYSIFVCADFNLTRTNIYHPTELKPSHTFCRLNCGTSFCFYVDPGAELAVLVPVLHSQCREYVGLDVTFCHQISIRIPAAEYQPIKCCRSRNVNYEGKWLESLKCLLQDVFADSDEISAIFQLREKCREKKSVLILFIMLEVNIFSFVMHLL